MNKKTLFVCSAITVITLALAYNGNVAVSKESKSGKLNVGIVSVKKIFDESKKFEDARTQITAEQERVMNELDTMHKEIEAQRAGLKTVKQGSTEYMELWKNIVSKQGELQAQNEFYKQKAEIEQRKFIIDSYSKIMEIAGEVAKKRNLDLVLERSELDLTSVPDDLLVMSILMRTVVHTEGCVDITDEVMAKLDKS